MLNNVQYGKVNNYTFSGIYPNESVFIGSVGGSGIPLRIKEESLKTLYYLLLANYTNSQIASSDINRFQLNVASIIYMYGPAWEKGIEIQDKLRNLTEEELLTGSTVIYNHSFNPSQAPSTNTLEELQTINDQNTTKNKRSKIDAYSMLSTILREDVTKNFLDKFKKLFNKFVEPDEYQTYITEIDEEDVI